MLDYQELLDILHSEGVDTADYSLSRLREYYGASMPKEKLLPIVQSMVLATLDYDTPLDELLCELEDFEQNEKVADADSKAFEVFDTVISNLKVCRENSVRLLDVIEDADSLSVYTAILTTFAEFYPENILTAVRDRAKNIFDPMLLPL